MLVIVAFAALFTLGLLADGCIIGALFGGVVVYVLLQVRGTVISTAKAPNPFLRD